MKQRSGSLNLKLSSKDQTGSMVQMKVICSGAIGAGLTEEDRRSVQTRQQETDTIGQIGQTDGRRCDGLRSIAMQGGG